MEIIKKFAIYLIKQLIREMRIEKVAPGPARPRQPVKENKILRTGLNGFAMIILITVVLAFFIL